MNHEHTHFEPAPDDPRIVATLAARARLDRAMQAGDIDTMRASFADDLVLQTPTHRIVDGAKILAVYAKSGQAAYDGGIEVRLDFAGARQAGVVLMGEEILPPAPSGPHAGRTVRRRFTDVWTCDGETARLQVRQATNIAIE